MKLFKNLKKGFTLIELVVVIAVIAILSAVSVVSYVSITNKAKNSEDETVLRQVNMAIAMRKTETEPATMSDALLALKEEGGVSDVEKLLTATYKKNTFAYDQKNKEFVLLKEGEEPEGEKINYFKMVGNQKELEEANGKGYSCYLKEIFSGKAITTKALDVGENADIISVEYSNTGSPQDVVIRTNGGNLKINGIGGKNGDTIYHYGKAVNVDIVSVGDHSYYENGIALAGISITQGHLVVNKNANVEKATPIITIKGANVDIETKDDSPIILGAGVTPTDKTIANNVKVTKENTNSMLTISDGDELETAFATGGFYSLTTSFEVSKSFVVIESREVTLDLAGFSVTYDKNATQNNTGTFIVQNGATLTINDSVGTGKVSGTGIFDENYSGTGVYSAIALTQKDHYNASPDVKKMCASLTINGGLIEGNYYAIVGNGSRHNTSIVINGGHIHALDGAGIYHPQNGKLNIAGGLVEGTDCGVYIKSGDMNANSSFAGGVIKCNSNELSFKRVKSGFEATGYAVVVDNADYPGGAPSASFGNVTFESPTGYHIFVGTADDAESSDVISSKNSFKLSDGYKWEQTGSGVFKAVKAN